MWEKEPEGRMRAALRRKAVLLVSTPVMSVTPRRTTRRAQLLRTCDAAGNLLYWHTTAARVARAGGAGGRYALRAFGGHGAELRDVE